MLRSVAFRVDASTAIGTGHVMRCLTLAQTLRSQSVRSHFVCREHEGSLCDLIEQRGFDVARLPPPQTSGATVEGTAYSQWLGASSDDDARQTQQALARHVESPLALIVDHYGIDERWERQLRATTERLMAIDDLADRRHDCDLLLDQNLVLDTQARYVGKVPKRTTMLLGPSFALLQPIYRELRGRVRLRGGPIRRVLIFFGGVDRDNLTSRALAAFLQLGRTDIVADVVIGNSMPHADQIQRLAAGHANVTLHRGLPTLAHLMAEADLALGAAGTTSWERLCLGLPALVVTLAENQRAPALGQSEAGLIRWLGDSDRVDQAAVFSVLEALVASGLDQEWSRRCFEAVDGLGAERVCAALTMTAETPLQLRRAAASDEALLLEWANEPETRRNAFTSDRISAETHRQWLRRRLASPESVSFYIAETEHGVPVGQVRFEQSEDRWIISYSLDAIFRGRGCGHSLLAAAMRAFAADRPGVTVSGLVKITNRPSCRIFEALGFSVAANDGAVVEYRRAL